MPVTRFAPSPNGRLHLGHALSALLNHEASLRLRGRFLLRIEDIDPARSRPEFEAAIYQDLAWLGLSWESPVRRQSEHLPEYRAALEELRGWNLVYPCRATRRELAEAVGARERGGAAWPRDPDGAPLYPFARREVTPELEEGCAWRLDMKAALSQVGADLSWREENAQGRGDRVPARPELWGDVVLARRDVGTSYHLSVVLDDALQGVTHIVRGQDLFHATGVHRVLQTLLGLPEPAYHHHRLLLGRDGRKLSKSEGARSLASLRESGATPADIRRLVGL